MFHTCVSISTRHIRQNLIPRTLVICRYFTFIDFFGKQVINTLAGWFSPYQLDSSPIFQQFRTDFSFYFFYYKLKNQEHISNTGWMNARDLQSLPKFLRQSEFKNIICAGSPVGFPLRPQSIQEHPYSPHSISILLSWVLLDLAGRAEKSYKLVQTYKGTFQKNIMRKL